MTEFRIRSQPDMGSVRRRFSSGLSRLQDELRDEMRPLARAFESHAGEEARGGRSGTIARQIKTRVSGMTFRTELGPIAAYHAHGTGIYGPRGRLIRPRHAMALRFVSGGEEVFAKYVRGVRPDNYIRRGHDRWLREADRRMTALARRFEANL